MTCRATARSSAQWLPDEVKTIADDLWQSDRCTRKSPDSCASSPESTARNWALLSFPCGVPGRGPKLVPWRARPPRTSRCSASTRFLRTPRRNTSTRTMVGPMRPAAHRQGCHQGHAAHGPARTCCCGLRNLSSRLRHVGVADDLSTAQTIRINSGSPVHECLRD